MTTAKVEGVRSTINQLRKVEPALARQSVTGIKRAAEPARGAVAAAAPAVPLSGMGSFGGVKVRTQYGGRRQGDEWPLVRIRLQGPGWTVASDMARNASPGESMVRNLSRKYGTASRWAWPAVESRLTQIQSAVLSACREVERAATRAMKG